MTTRIVRGGALVFALALAAGCKKPKPTEPDTAPPPVTPGPRQPPPANTGGAAGGPNVGIVPSGVGGGVVTNPGAIAGGGGGGGAVMAVRKAVRRTQALNEMSQLGLLIEELRDPVGKMPTKEQILASLKTTAPTIYKAITEDGSYILTGTTEGSGLWAYEVDADKTAGIALIGGKAMRSTPDELAPYFRKN